MQNDTERTWWADYRVKILSAQSRLIYGLIKSPLVKDDQSLTAYLVQIYNLQSRWVVPGIYRRIRNIADVQSVCVSAQPFYGLKEEVERSLSSVLCIAKALCELWTVLFDYKFANKHVRIFTDKYFLAALGGRLEEFLKFQFNYACAEGLAQQEKPERPKDLPLEEKNGFLIGGLFYRRQCALFHRSTRYLTSFRKKVAWTLGQIKRVSDPAPKDFIDRNLEKHKVRASTLHPYDPDLLQVLDQEVERTVKEVYKYSRQKVLDIRLPSGNAHIERTKGNGGALMEYFENPYAVLSGGFLVSILEPRPGMLSEIRTYILEDDIEDIYIKERCKSLLTNRTRCIPSPVLEPFKVRVITLGPINDYWVAKNHQLQVHTIMRNHPTFQLVGRPINNSLLQEFFERTCNYSENATMISGDYEAASDNINPTLSNTALDVMSQLRHIPLGDHYILKKTLTGHELFYDRKSALDDSLNGVVQIWGQFMGSPTSFPILCLINAAVTRYAIELSLGRRLKLSDCPMLINGDDVLFYMNENYYPIWKMITECAGLKFSLGKNFTSKQFGVINSSIFDVGSFVNFFGEKKLQFSSNPYINMGLVYGKTRVQTSSRSEDLFKSDQYTLDIGQKHEALILGHALPLQEKLTTLYIRNNIEKLSSVPMCSWWVPKVLGGYGLKLYDVERCKISEAQRKLAAYLFTAKTPEELFNRSVLSDRNPRMAYSECALRKSCEISSIVGQTFEEGFDNPDLGRFYVPIGMSLSDVESRFPNDFPRVLREALRTNLEPISMVKLKLFSAKKISLIRGLPLIGKIAKVKLANLL